MKSKLLQALHIQDILDMEAQGHWKTFPKRKVLYRALVWLQHPIKYCREAEEEQEDEEEEGEERDENNSVFNLIVIVKI